MKKERFDRLFQEAFPSAVRASYRQIDVPSAARIRLSWQTFLRKRADALVCSNGACEPDCSGQRVFGGGE